MNHTEFIGHVKRQVAEIAVGASALRNQGGNGLVQAARTHFKRVDLETYATTQIQDDFIRLLDDDTEAIRKAFPLGAQNWGAARKAMNLFLRDATYNRFLCHEFGLGRIERWLEVPVDNDVAKGLISAVENGVLTLPPGITLPEWNNIKSLTYRQNASFQKAAQALADSHQVSRVHADLLYWRKKNAEPTNVP